MTDTGQLAIQLGAAGKATAARKHAAEIERLAPLARDLALRAGPEGITVDSIRIAAGMELAGRGREYSWLVAVPKAAGLVATDRTRRSVLMSTHARRQVVHVHPEWA